MIILDTNVISEPLQKSPSPSVVDWLNNQIVTTLFTTSITIHELNFGIQRLPAGQRKDNLQIAVRYTLSKLVGTRIFSFDDDVAEISGMLFAECQSKGFQLGFADGLIAAIALKNGFKVATRDVEPFMACGAEVMDPWKL